MRRTILALIAAALLAAPAAAQLAKPIATDSTITALRGMAFGTLGTAATPVDASHPLPTIGQQESFQLVAANSPTGPVAVAGGDYILTQLCSGYGTVTLQVLGPDAATWLTLASYTAADTGAGHGFALASYARVRITVSGTTGCAAMLARVPA